MREVKINRHELPAIHTNEMASTDNAVNVHKTDVVLTTSCLRLYYPHPSDWIWLVIHRRKPLYKGSPISDIIE